MRVPVKLTLRRVKRRGKPAAEQRAWLTETGKAGIFTLSAEERKKFGKNWPPLGGGRKCLPDDS